MEAEAESNGGLSCAGLNMELKVICYKSYFLMEISRNVVKRAFQISLLATV
jgi:hypothetical protein